MLTRFVDGRVLTAEDGRASQTLPKIVASLRRYHETQPGPGRFSVFETVRSWPVGSEGLFYAKPQGAER